MKLLFVALILTLSACGSESRSPRQNHFEAILPAQYEGNIIVTEGIYLGDPECFVTWPASMPYEIDAEGAFRTGENVFKPVEGQEKTYFFRKGLEDYVGVIKFNMLAESIIVTLDCFRRPQPISEAL